MFGWLTIKEKQTGFHSAVTGGTKRICGVRFFEVTVAESRSRLLRERRLQKAARLMERAGVRRALFPKGFSETATFEKQQIRPADDSYLLRQMAVELTRKAMETRGILPADCCVAVLGDGMSGDLRRALPEIALRVRRTLLSAKGGGGEICSRLWREYGVSVLRDPSEKELCRASVVLTFGKAVPLGEPGCLWLPFGAVQEAEGYKNALLPVRFSLPAALEQAEETGVDGNVLLSLLLEVGALHENELKVMEIGQNA